MGRFQLSNIVTDRLIAADGVSTYDMGVQPLSVILLRLNPLNDTGTLANWANAFRIAQAVNRLTLLYRGESIVSMRGEDIAAYNFYRWGMVPQLVNADNVDNERRSLTLPVVLGRWPYSRTSCFPASGKGELQLELDLDIADTGYDGLRISVDALELPDGKPKEYEKRVQQSLTFAATGNNDIDMPVGNLLRGFLLWGTTGYDGATPAPSFGQVSVLLDNAEAGIRAMDWESLVPLHMLLGRHPLPPTEDSHFHTTTTDGNAQTAVETLGGGGYNRSTEYNRYAFLDYDPTGDDSFALDAKGARRLQLRVNAETADAVRVVPVEVIKV